MNLWFWLFWGLIGGVLFLIWSLQILTIGDGSFCLHYNKALESAEILKGHVEIMSNE